MKRLASALMFSCVVGTHAWADAKADCHQRGDRDRQLKGCTQYIEENQADPAKSKELVAAHLFRASAYLHKRDHDLAVADLTKAIELDPQNGRTYGLRGLRHFNNGEYDRAIADYTRAIELRSNAPNHLLASQYVVRGVAYQKTRNADLAIADFRRALAIEPDHRGAKDWLKRLGVTP
jgi:tetratricopeptide (TPR) repeat protein